MNKTIFSILLLFSFFGSAEIVDTGHARISLIKDHSDFVPGTSINIGLKVSMDKGWHTYWRNPGDSGGPIVIDWDLPKGFSVSNIKWPLPEKMEYPPLMTYGYEDFVIYPMVLSIPADYSDDYFEMNADILICADVCIPESGKISSNLLDIESDSLIYEWLESVPSKSLPITTSLNDNNLEISFTFEKEIKEIYFFPDENNSIDYSSKQNFYKKDDGYFLSIKLFNDEFQNVSGVLDIDGTGYNVSNGKFEDFNEEGLSLITALIFALIGGLILNLMPCVFPVISLKVLSFVSMGGSSQRKIRNHALVFTVGVIASFMLIALTIVLLKQAGNFVGWGFQLQSPLIVGLLSLVMVFISLVLITDNSFGESLTKLGNVGSNENGYYSIYESDRYGFNNPDKEWDQNEIEYFLVGNSFAHGACINRPHDIASVLRILSKKTVLNLGFSSSGPLITYGTLREYLNSNAKKVLWIYNNNNDLQLLEGELTLNIQLKNQKRRHRHL